MNYYYNPVRTIQGVGCVNNLPDVLKELKLERKKVLLITWNEQIIPKEVTLKLLESDYGFEVKTLLFSASNPTVEQLFETFQATKEYGPEVVVAVGGGSIMDVGKSLCCLYGKEISTVDELRKIIVNKEFGEIKVPWIGIPTTAGTGSEVTCWATIWDPSKEAKRSVENHNNYAYAAIVDPNLAAGMPVNLAVSSALDAVAHAVESYWAKGTNCVSRAIALQAIRIIMGNIEQLINHDPKAHDAMAKGSMLAGLAFSNTKTTACHSISYPLTMHYRIPHGAAVSMLLAPVLQMNLLGIEGREALLEALGVKKAEELREKIENILKASGQPTTLKEWGVEKESLSHLAELGITKGRADNNPVEITVENVKVILESVYTEN